MYKIYKIVLIWFVVLYSTCISAQVNEYLDAENARISQSQKTELEVRKFVNDNFKKYKLSHDVNDKLIQHLKEEEEFTEAELKNAINKEKIYELRKLFFHENPDKKENYIAKPIPNALREQCVNGDFENNTAGYTFWSDQHPQPASGADFFLSCATPTALTASNVITPNVNDFNSTITLIDNTSPGYQQFDPVLASFGVNVPTLNTNSGTKCIKLNNQEGYGSSDQTTVSRYFPNINEATIEFNFSLVMDNKPAHGQDIQPFFRARVYDQFNNIVDEFCIVANPENCLFEVIYVSRTRRVLYTDWICARLNVGEILNQPGTIEFTVSDCQPSAHFGTVYIDNICGFTCATPQLGALNTDPININCPDVANNEPFQVCGTFQPPVNATLNTIVLNIMQNGSLVGTINAPTQLTADSFCFTVFPNLLGANPSGDFELLTTATFNVSCPAGTFVYSISDNSANIGPDISFVDCCIPTLYLSAAAANNLDNLAPMAIRQRQRSNWIIAANIVSVGDNALSNGVIYHAGNFVELTPGFEAEFGAQFAAYPEGCSENYIYKNDTQNNNSINTIEKITDETINLVKIARGFSIYPNPSSSTIDIKMKDSQFKKVSITTIDGKMVYERNVEPTDTTQIDVSRYANGVYIITITSEDGELLTEKLIKN